MIQQLGAAAAATLLGGCSSNRARHQARVVIVGGGFAGASCARVLKRLQPQLAVTLIEPQPVYTACPLSNLVVAAKRPLKAQQFRYHGLAKSGVEVVQATAEVIDPERRQVQLADGTHLGYDRLVAAPGIDLRWDALPGYDRSAAEHMPHAWKAGAQSLLLRDQIKAMPDGGVVVIAVPDNPYRCPPGPYERASLIADYLTRYKPRAKLLILDAKDRFSKQPLFMQGWAARYGAMIEWQGASDGAAVVAVDAQTLTLQTDFEHVKANVANVIPPQQAGGIAIRSGLTDASGWCPITAATFASTLQPDIHVIGDAAIANAMPKSAFAANAQARLCAVQIVRSLNGLAPISSTLLNTCYSLLAPGYGISVAGAYRPEATQWQPVPGAGGASPLKATDAVRAREAGYGLDWFTVLTRQVWG